VSDSGNAFEDFDNIVIYWGFVKSEEEAKRISKEHNYSYEAISEINDNIPKRFKFY